MLIIDKKGRKDYYDYLTGIYGIDNKIVLDRTKFDHKEWFDINDRDEVWSLAICGKRIDFVYSKRQFLYLDELNIYPKIEDRWFEWNNDISNKVCVNRDDYIYNIVVYDKEQVNLKLNCPIILTRYRNNDTHIDYFEYKYPNLRELQFNKVMQPQEIYLLLVDWLSPKDKESNILSDKEKIVSNGFDIITSFRNIK